MRGRILGYNGSDFRGIISGQDGQRYDFVRIDWQGAGEPGPGMDVDFRIDAAMARDIFLVAPTAGPAQPYPPYGQTAQPYGQPGQPYGQPSQPYGHPQPPPPNQTYQPYGQPNPAQPPYGQPGQTYPPPGQPHARPSYPQREMGFGDAIRICFEKYATFSGRARRAEFWWFVLFDILVRSVTALLDTAVMHGSRAGPFNTLAGLALLIPWLAVATRRMHDTNRSGFWVLGFFIVLIVLLLIAGVAVASQLGASEPGPGAAATMGLCGLAMLGVLIWGIVLACIKGTHGSNQYGPDPLSTPADVF